MAIPQRPDPAPPCAVLLPEEPYMEARASQREKASLSKEKKEKDCSETGSGRGLRRLLSFFYVAGVLEECKHSDII